MSFAERIAKNLPLGGMARPLGRRDWRILFRYWKVTPKGSYEGKTLDELNELLKIHKDFWDFMVNLKDLCEELPEESSDEEDSEIEAGSEGNSESETDEEENEIENTSPVRPQDG
jgi:hypothetical protein